MNKVICPKCKVPMIRREDTKFKKGYHWWSCPNYPFCVITCAENLDGTLMSTPADSKLKELRVKAHALGRKIWKEKSEMYQWLEKNTETGHFGLMEQQEILNTIQKLIKIYEKKTNEI